MSLTRHSRRAALLSSVTAGVLAAGLSFPALAFGADAPTHAAAGGHHHATAPGGRTGSPDSALSRVADFYGAYTDAVDDPGTGHLDRQLRRHFLTRDLRRHLARWEERNHADGVLRAQDVPYRWRVTYDGSGAGHTWALVTFTWSPRKDAEVSRLAVQTDLRTKRISAIRPVPVG